MLSTATLAQFHLRIAMVTTRLKASGAVWTILTSSATGSTYLDSAKSSTKSVNLSTVSKALAQATVQTHVQKTCSTQHILTAQSRSLTSLSPPILQCLTTSTLSLSVAGPPLQTKTAQQRSIHTKTTHPTTSVAYLTATLHQAHTQPLDWAINSQPSTETTLVCLV